MAVVDQDKLTMSEKVRINIGGRIKVKLGSQLDIKCPSKGVPPPKFAWFRNNKELDDDDDVVIKGQGSVLRIPYVRRSNEATYFCVASNGVGAKSKGSIKVTVYGE